MGVANLIAAIDAIDRFKAVTANATKEIVTGYAAESLHLTRRRSVFRGPGYAIRLSAASGASFSNVVLSLSALQEYDHEPFAVCIVRPEGNQWLLANTTFLKKFSHSSHQLRVDNIRGSFLGHDILREFEGIANAPVSFQLLFDLHQQFSWTENLARLVERTNRIAARGLRAEPTEEQAALILAAPERARFLSENAEYHHIARDLDELVIANAHPILTAGRIENPKIRGDTIEGIITHEGVAHRMEDLLRTTASGTQLFIDVKTKVAGLASNPKAYNVDKVLNYYAGGQTAFSFLFIGIDTEARTVRSKLISILDRLLIENTRVQFHWAGRNSRGVTQLVGNYADVLQPAYQESIDTPVARTHLKTLLGIPAY